MLRIRKLFWLVIALIFLIEAWLWDHIQPTIRRIVDLFAWLRLRAWTERLIDRLPPWATLLVFATPLIVLEPVKLGALWIAARGQPVLGLTIYIVAKIAGLAVTVFLFEICRPKLMQMAWFAKVYAWFEWARAWARQQMEPARAIVRRLKIRILGEKSKFQRMFHWLRRARQSKPDGRG
jgi:hypothetical protein